MCVSYPVCRTDQGSCGCCKMIKEVHYLTEYMNQTLTEFENKLRETKERFRILKSKWTHQHVGFKAVYR